MVFSLFPGDFPQAGWPTTNVAFPCGRMTYCDPGWLNPSTCRLISPWASKCHSVISNALAICWSDFGWLVNPPQYQNALWKSWFRVGFVHFWGALFDFLPRHFGGKGWFLDWCRNSGKPTSPNRSNKRFHPVPGFIAVPASILDRGFIIPSP